MLTIDAFLSTLITLVGNLDYENIPAKQRERYNTLLGFKPVRRNGVSAARQITEAGTVNGFAAKAGDYHVRPLNDYHFTDDLGWVVDSDIFRTTYAWLTFEALGNPPELDGGWGACRKSVATWVYDTTRFFPWDSAVIVSTLEADQPLYWGDWLAIGIKGELWPIEAAKHAAYENMEGVK